MNANQEKFRILLIGLIAAALFTGAASAQTLTVTWMGSSNGPIPIFAPGDSVTATVTLTNGPSPLTQAWLIAEIPIGVNPLSTVLDPADIQGTFTLAATLPFGLYHFSAYAQDSQGNVYQSAPVPFNVETMAASATSYSVTPTSLTMRYVGDQSWINVYGVLPSGITADVTYATVSYFGPPEQYDVGGPILYGSLNPNVAVVDNYGTVTAIGPGVTCITVTGSFLLPPNPNIYPGSTGSVILYVQVTVPPAIRGDLNGDGRVDLLDLDILEERLNSAALTNAGFVGTQVPVTDARDLNGDGVINALDARILVTLCTHPGCVVQ
jgi:hypothetical protein